jgi:hypothetical protein
MESVMPKQIKEIGNPTYHADLDLVVAPLTFTDGETVEVAIPVAEIGRLVSYFAGLNDFLSSQGVSVKRGRKDDLFGPIRVHGLGFHAGPEDTMLVLDLAGCRLGFALESTQLIRFARELPQVALALSADRKKAQ